MPTTGSILALPAANWTTALGALCFFIGAVMLFPRRRAEAESSANRPLVSKEVRR